ncbi:dihydropteroate synthase [Bacteroidales bacterium OttesenSCG-928-I14]|nr:dihydropteroate synthase [Bacteroidales bacterium OttesenSCG-928-I14]
MKLNKQNLTTNINGELIDFASPKVMGILNFTPDSFYSASRKQTEEDIIIRARQIVEEGGDMIDVGAYSSRPNAAFVSAEEEMERLRFGLGILFKEFPEAVVSVDTFRADVARMSVEEFGVAIINDIAAGELDDKMFDTVAELNVPYCIMHMQGTPQSMMEYVQYEQLLPEMILYFSKKIDLLRQKGVNDIWVDPGFGFSKTTEQNYEVLAKLEELCIFELPILVGFSRKTMIREAIQVSVDDSLNGTTALNMLSLTKGADILRVHDVKEAKEVVRLFNKTKEQE